MTTETKLFRPSHAPALMQCARYEGREWSDEDAETGNHLHAITEALVVGTTPLGGWKERRT